MLLSVSWSYRTTAWRGKGRVDKVKAIPIAFLLNLSKLCRSQRAAKLKQTSFANTVGYCEFIKKNVQEKAGV